MNSKLNKNEKIEIIQILISTTSLIISFFYSINHLPWIAIILCGIPIIKDCIQKLITELNIKTDLLVSIAIITSILIGETFAAGEIATIMAIGSFLENYTISKTQRKIKKLAKITPTIATRIKNEKEEKINIKEINTGDTIKVLPGETIACDGIIIEGKTTIDQSTLTGESMPINKFKGDEIYSGTINLHGSIILKTTKKSKDSSIQKLIKLVNSSSPENAKIVKSADKWAVWIVIIAFSVSILTYLFTGKIIQSVTILVVFCPCALVLATPTAIMATIGNLTKHGILVKEGQSIEELAHTNELIFDKTGTLTYGKPKVVKIRSKDENMMYLLASLESKSEHPIAKAIMDYYGDKNLGKVENFKMIIGKGIKGIINGDEVTAGNKKLLEDEKIKLKNTSKLKKGESNVFLVKNREVIGEIILADVLREEAKSTVEKLKLLEIKTTLMTGDNEQIGRYIANKLKITNSKYNCLPEDKIKYIKEEQLKNNRITMIGDGINDAPSLKKANVGIAMGKIGSDISIEAANITLIKDNIGDLPHLIGISRKTLRTININITFSLLLNITAMFLAVLGILNPITGALIHNIGSVIVIIYSILLLKYELSSKDYKKLGMTKNLNRIN